MKFKKERNQMNYAEKLCCISYFPKESLKDEDASIRLKAYRALGFTKEALKDQHYRVRLEAYRALWWTKEAFNDEYRNIKLEAYRALWWTEEALKDEEEVIREEAQRFFDLVQNDDDYIIINWVKYKRVD